MDRYDPTNPNPGNGKQVDGESYLGFDGKYIMPNATPVYLHKA